MNIKLHKAITAGIVLYLCSAIVLIVMGLPPFGLFGAFLWARAWLVGGRPPDVPWLAGLFLGLQRCALVLIVYGLIREFVLRRIPPTAIAKDRAWPHFAVAALLAIAAVSVLIAFDVWTSTKLDFVGATAHGSSEPVDDAVIRYEFTAETGQTIAAIQYNSPKGNIFVYLRENPHVFKVKGSGRGPQIGLVLLLGLAAWQLVTAVHVLRKTNIGGNGEQ